MALEFYLLKNAYGTPPELRKLPPKALQKYFF